MRFSIGFILKKLYQGQSLARIRMNQALLSEAITGRVVDIGGGRQPDYFEYLQKEGSVEVEPLDGSISGIDFERDPLPFPDASVDTALLCNVLEHIYRHQFLLEETRRVLRPGGRLIGFVPFWTGYHPDPHDYFRYTGEALERMLADAGFSKIAVRPVGGGPVAANFNTLVLSLPRALRPLSYLPYALFDRVFLALRPESRNRNPLGFVFTAHA